MNELIRITEQDGKQAVSARELHSFLESKAQFSDWCKRMFEYGFIENVDYVIFSQNCEKGRPKIDYALTLDCGKEISMLQRSDKGKQARQYFIACEKKSKHQIPQSYSEALKLAASLAEELEEKKKLLEAQRPKVEESKPPILIGELSKILKQNGIEIGRNKLYEWMREEGFLNKGESYNTPTQKAMDLGLLEAKERVMHFYGIAMTCTTPKVTGKGQIYFVNHFINILKGGLS